MNPKILASAIAIQSSFLAGISADGVIAPELIFALLCPLRGNQIRLGRQGAVPKVKRADPQALTTAEAGRLASVSREAVHKAIKTGRLKGTRGISASGHNKGRPVFTVTLDDLAALWPAVSQRWISEGNCG